jgi:hypothetical protein
VIFFYYKRVQRGSRQSAAFRRTHRTLGRLNKVIPTTEALPGSRQQDHVNLRVEVGALDQTLELGQQPTRDAIAALGAVERDPRDTPVYVELDGTHTG